MSTSLDANPGQDGLATELREELAAECSRQGFSPTKAAQWKTGMLDASRGQKVWTYLSPHLPPRPRLLDLGCGYGAAAAGLLQQTDDVWALDIRFDRARFTRRRLPQLRAALVAEACNLPFADGTFHGVVFHDVIEHIPAGQQEHAMREVARILAPGGVVAMRSPNRWQLRDEHNEGVLLASWLPQPVRQPLCNLLSSSAYCHTWNLSWSTLARMIEATGLEVLFGPKTLKEKILKPNFALLLRKPR